jgi:hypothetical protein
MATTFRALAMLALLPVATLSCVSASPPPPAEPGPTRDWIAESRGLAQQLGSELKAELTRAMIDDGPVGAISVCRDQAPAIAARLSAQSGATVGRTSHRVRNPANAPDGMQRVLLDQFANELASGKFQGPLEAAFEVNRGGQVERRYMRAIPMEGLCVTCHGKVLAPELAAAIAAQYPADEATGFEPGQLRGAFTVTWPSSSPLPPTP